MQGSSTILQKDERPPPPSSPSPRNLMGSEKKTFSKIIQNCFTVMFGSFSVSEKRKKSKTLDTIVIKIQWVLLFNCNDFFLGQK
jgi:hypothetical protein